MSFSPNDNFWLNVTQGLVTKYSEEHVFGTSADISTTFVPIARDNVYATPTTAQSLEILSSDANDTSAGTGARTVTIRGLNSSWVEVEQTVSMNGTTAVALGTDLIRVYEMYVATSGAYATQTVPSHLGTITLRIAGGGATWLVIYADGFPRGQSQCGIRTIPAGKTAVAYYHYAAVDANKSADLIFFSRENADTVAAPYSGMRAGPEFVGLSGFLSLIDIASPAGPFVGPCDIGFMGTFPASTGSITIDYELVLFDTI